MRFLLFLFASTAIFLTGCNQATPTGHGLRILAIGDSMMASHSISGRAIADVLERDLNNPVTDRSVLGARMIYNLPISGAVGMSIPKQFRDGEWDWVVVNGGGNDLLFGCGCVACDRKMDKLISQDGRRGKIPGLLSKLRQSGARVIFVGYLRSPGAGSPIEHCRDEGNELDNRLTRLAALDTGLYFLSLADLVPHGDRSYHAFDMVHPSLKGSTAIGQRVAAVIREN